MDSLIILVALAALWIAIVLLVRQKLAHRIALVPLGLGATGLGIGTVLHGNGFESASWLMMAAGLLTVAAGSTLAWSNDRRAPWSLDASLDATIIGLLALMCGWGIVLWPLHVQNQHGPEVLAGILATIGFALFAMLLVSTGSRRTMPVIVAGSLMASGTLATVSRLDSLQTAAGWFGAGAALYQILGLVGSATTLLIATRMNPHRIIPWTPINQVRNTLIVFGMLLAPIGLAISNQLVTRATSSAIVIWLALASAIAAIRFIRVLRHIGRLETTKQTRDALSAVPMGALSVTDDRQFDHLLTQVTDLAMQMFGTKRAQLTLMLGADSEIDSFCIARGLTDTEQTMLNTHPRLEPSVCLTAAGTWRPVRIRRTDRVLPVAAQGAWAVAGKGDCLVIPICNGASALGLLELWSPDTAINPGDVDFDIAQTFGRDAAQAIEHAHLVMRTRSQVEQADMLLAVSEAFSRGFALDSSLIQVADRLLGHAGSDRITIGLVQRDRAEIYIAAEVDIERPGIGLRHGERFSLDQWLTYGAVRKSGKQQIWSREDPDLDPDAVQVLDQFNCSSLLAIPGYLDGRLAVLVQIMSRSSVLAESSETRAIWRLIAQQIQLGIESTGALQESRRSERLESMRRRINESLQTVDQLDKSYQAICQIFQRLPDIHGATVLSWDEERDGLVVEADWAEPPIVSWEPGLFIPTGSDRALDALRTSLHPQISALDDPSLSEDEKTRMRSLLVGSALAVPLRSEDRLVGGLLLVSHRTNGFSDETVSYAVELATSIGLVVKAIELRRAEGRLAQEQAFRLQLLEAASSRNDPQAALEAIASAGLGREGAESIDIAFYDVVNDHLVIASDTTVDDWPGVELPGTAIQILPGSVQEIALRELRPARFSSSDPMLSRATINDIELYGAHAWLALPLIVEGQPTGLLQVLSRDPDAFPDRRFRLWTEIARQIAPVVRSLHLSLVNQRLSQQKSVVGHINEIAATPARPAETWADLARVGLIPNVDAATILLCHAVDDLLEVAFDATANDSALQLPAGLRLHQVRWDDSPGTPEPRPVAHLWRGDPDLAPVGAQFLNLFDAGAVAIFTLVDKGQVLGVLMLRSTAAAPFSDETLETGNLIATNLGPIARNIRDRASRDDFESAQSALVEISNAVASGEDLGEIQEVITQSVRHLMDGQHAWLIERALDNGDVRVLATGHAPGEQVDPWPAGHVWSADQAPIGPTGTNRARVIDHTNDPWLLNAFGNELLTHEIASCALIPMNPGRGREGHIIVTSPLPHRFIHEDILSIRALIERAELMLEHARSTMEEQQVAEQRAVLLRVSQAASNAVGLTQVLHEITSASLGVANSESCVIELFDPRTGLMEIGGLARVQDWVITDELIGKSRPFGAWATDSELRERQTIVLASLDDERISGLMQTEMRKFQTQSLIGHALTSGGQFIGAYYLFSRVPNAYRERDIWTTSEVAHRIVGAIQSARSLESERRLSIERERLLQISEAATSSLETESVLQQIATSTIGLAGAECCHIEMIDWDAREFITEAYASVSDWAPLNETQIGARSEVGQWSIDHDSVTRNEVIAISSIDDERVVGRLREDMLEYGTQSILIIPIWLREECIGILNLYSRRAHAFSTDQQLLASTLAKQAANAIQNARTHSLERGRRLQQEVTVRLSAAATSSLDLNLAMSALCQEINALTGIQSATVGIYRPDAQGFEIAADFTVANWDDPGTMGQIVTLQQYDILAEVLAGQSSVAIARSRREGTDRLWQRLHPDMDGLVLIPLWLNGACLGYIGLFDRRPDAIQTSTIGMLESACPTISLAVSNALQWRDETRRASSRAAIVDVGRIAVSERPIAEKLDGIATACLQVYRVDSCFIMEKSPETGALSYLAWHSLNGTITPSDLDFVDMDLTPVSKTIDDELGTLTFGVTSPEVPEALQELMLSRGIRSVAAFPLKTDEQMIGYLVFTTADPYPFDQDGLSMGRELATQISLTIASSRLLDTTRRYAQEQAALLAANRSVMAVTQESLADALQRISLETMALIGAECCEIEGLLEGHHATELLAQVKVSDWTWESSGPGRVLPLIDWPATVRVMETRQPICVNTDDRSLSPEERAGLSQYGSESVLIAPMQLNDTVTGIISFYSRRRDFFSDDQIRLATEFGSLAALAIDRARTHHALSEQATRDGLTGTLNRRALIHHLDHQIAVATRNNDLISILMIDLNDFKSVNDTYGHLVGDAVLREIAVQLQGNVRASDLVGRYGGDEFMAILPSTDSIAAISLARRMHDTVTSAEIMLPNGTSLRPSFAIGAATYPLDAQDREGLIETADRAMYISKSNSDVPAVYQQTGTDSLALRVLPR